MRGVFRKGFREYEFLNSRQTRFMKFSDRFSALEFLRGFFYDQYYITVLRKLLEREMFGFNLSGISDYGVLERIADLLASGKIRVVERHDLFEAGFHAVTAVQEEVSEPAPAEEYVEEEEPEEEPRPEPAPPIAEAQAATLIQAAQSGAALCEA